MIDMGLATDDSFALRRFESVIRHGRTSDQCKNKQDDLHVVPFSRLLIAFNRGNSEP